MNAQQNNGLLKKINSLSTFTLVLSDGSWEGELFANGNMQVGIIINIKADTGNINWPEIVPLSPEQLDSIELVNKITGEKLSGEWAYSSEPNDYFHQFPRRGITRDTNLSYGRDATNDDLEPQRKTYWLKTKKIETIEIMARVTLDGKTFLSDDFTHKGSHIFVTGRQPIIYHSDSLVLKTEENVAHGTYEFKETITIIDMFGEHPSTSSKYPTWTQNNYYIFPKEDHGFAVHDVEIRNTINDNDSLKYNYRRFTHHTEDGRLFLWFLWGAYSTKRKAGAAYRITTITDPASRGRVKREATPQEEIVTTPRTDVVSLSRLCFENPAADFWVDQPDQIPQFKFRDIYGNESVFLKIIMDKADFIHLQEG
ncbi:hypothetical protein [Xenorhabdus hominickii]|uniref:Uncharacterized protein n=1 Tax=Xenorhabdus hominickii TaxID=351679 RepID=A0A2G0Q2S4_XENHO|nr:hypothetical protein [Xenorhabdus hominickii]AOM39752.1 hypothetical protein A9255_03640 [Xenorhabdus hominickii]PHM53524.1 hypothetical protein Xhom_03522 [Xenorhabdus hominickii]